MHGFDLRRTKSTCQAPFTLDNPEMANYHPTMSTLQDTFRREQDKRDAQIRKWLNAGLSKAEIARRLGVSRQRVYTLALRLK